jgi:AP-1 complex subunit beta-1
MEVLDEPEAKASMIWILGEYAERIENVDDLLDTFLEHFHDEPPIVQQQLLTAIVKLFLKKPNTTQDMVSRVLKCATEESNNHDLRDRGYIYWRLLSTNPEATKHVVLGDKPTIRDESQVLEKTLLERLIADLALMSSVYHKPREEFITRISTTSQAEETTVDDDEEVDEEDRAETRRKVKEEMEGGGSSNGKTKDAPPSGTAGGAALDLLDLDGGGDDMLPPAPVVQKVQVLPPTQAGQNGKAGCGIAAALVRQAGGIQLMLTVTNSTQMVINGFAIQVNKNPFGISPVGALQVPDLMPGSSLDATLAMNPNLSLSNTPPTNPLVLQVAIKNSLDIFYFNVPFDVSAVFLEAPVAKDLFTQVWQKVGEGSQTRIDGQVASPMTADSLRNLLQSENIGYVAQRQKDEETTYVYVAATCSNNVVLLAEVTLNRSSTSIEVKMRSEQPVLIEVFQACLVKRLGLRK